MCRGCSIPDLMGESAKLVFVGINPGLQTALTGIHFAHPSNRFWPALRQAGIIDWSPELSPASPAVTLDLDAPDDELALGLSRSQRHDFIGRGLGITNLAHEATARASELSTDQLRNGADELRSKIDRIGPRVVAIAGVTAFRTAFERPGAAMGRQDGGLASSELWVVPNPSGLNAHETINSLSDWYARVAVAAGVL